MSSNCDCVRGIKRTVDDARKEALLVERAYITNLESFRDSILEGARERIARMLFKAGVYQTSIRLNIRKDFGSEQVIRTLEKSLLSDKNYNRLYSFFGQNIDRISSQAGFVKIEDLLKHMISRRKEAEGLLIISYERELKGAMSALDRADKLKGQLDAWKANTRLQDKVQYTTIVDMHNK